MSTEPVAITAAVSPTQTPQDGAEDRARLWAVWRQLVEEFRFGRLVRHLIRSKSGWGLYGVDVVSTLTATPMAAAARPILADLDDAQLGFLLGVARINAERNDSLWKMAALFYVSGPVTAVLAGFQMAPEFTRLVLTQGGLGFVVVVLCLMFSLLFYYTINWRAGQVAALIELEQLERAGKAGSTPARTR